MNGKKSKDMYGNCDRWVIYYSYKRHLVQLRSLNCFHKVTPNPRIGQRCAGYFIAPNAHFLHALIYDSALALEFKCICNCYFMLLLVKLFIYFGVSFPPDTYK